MQQNVDKVRVLGRDEHAWNVDGSSTDLPCEGSWIRKWEVTSGRQRGTCGYRGCDRAAEHGGHIWIKRQGVFIVPICPRCNRCDNAERMQSDSGDHSYLKAGTVVIGPRRMTTDMRRCERRISTTTEARRCTSCRADISDRLMSHTVCYDCFCSKTTRRCTQCTSSTIRD